MITLDKWNRQTAEVLAAMFTENTGTHFLDSGGAYGRAWERNQGKTVEDFAAAPSVTEADHKYGCYSINMFQWLLANLTYDPIMQRRFELVIGDTDDPHLVDAENFAEKMHEGSGYWGSKPHVFNSYNGETLLDGTIQGVLFTRGGDQYIALQVHGGCDVRGGYTAPKMFQIEDIDYWGDESIEFYCNACEWGVDLNLTEWVSREGEFLTESPIKEDGLCPSCGKEIAAEARLQH